MNINSLTIKAQEALQGAVSLAKQHGQQAVEPMHLLAVLVREDDSLASFLLGRVGVNVRGLRDEASRAVASLPRVEGGGDPFFSTDSSKAIQRAVDFTRNFGDKYASVEHLLLGLIAERVRLRICSNVRAPPKRSCWRRSVRSAKVRRSIRPRPRKSSMPSGSMPSTSTRWPARASSIP